MVFKTGKPKNRGSLSKTRGGAVVYLFWGKARKYRRLEETQRKYTSERHMH